ncbi:type IV pili methyl-accepting chemotaxis transducer N-terminal domain-containing protein [Sulfurimonas sp. HSL-1716]|uniref:type IV pili methyl-accepting chemotaxis transducer N-terminal domain-containing protein n=1 Tax=Hydrocurvibacter sulfurireducens TaxID=3131937 RepID=UPI0031F96CAC
MKKQNIKITTKIKIYGAVLVTLMLSLISISIYLNQKNTKDALLINIAGKQRMLTQKITKDIFYIYYSKNANYTDLDVSTNEFMKNFKYIKQYEGLQDILELSESPISVQLDKVDHLWNGFYNDIVRFKQIAGEDQNSPELKGLVDNIFVNNTVLLKEVDRVVAMLTELSENKIKNIENLQYSAGFILIVLIIYIISKLRSMESNALTFIEHTKSLSSLPNNVELKPLNNVVESEIVEMSDIVNLFINKINSAIEHSNEAVSQSKHASVKLEEITEELNYILDELSDNTLLLKHLSASEDMAIQSTEELFSSTNKLKRLSDELNKLLIECTPK